MTTALLRQVSNLRKQLFRIRATQGDWLGFESEAV